MAGCRIRLRGNLRFCLPVRGSRCMRQSGLVQSSPEKSNKGENCQ